MRGVVSVLTLWGLIAGMFWPLPPASAYDKAEAYTNRVEIVWRNNRLIIHMDSIGTRVVFAPLFTVFPVFSHDESKFPFRSTISID